jgi:hypothetical protein
VSDAHRLSVADRLDIAELLAKRYFYADHGDFDALAGCYANDVVINIVGAGTFTGADWQVDHAKSSYESTGGKNRHVITNLWVEPAGGVADAAVARYLLLNFVAGTKVGDPEFRTTGRFADHVSRGPDGWKITRREFAPDQPFKFDEEGGR